MAARRKCSRPASADFSTILAALALALATSGVFAESTTCHVTYGGATQQIVATPTHAPHGIPTVQIGSYFLFRLVFEANTAIKTYIFADRDEGPWPVHQSVFPYPPPQARQYGFTGLNFVYEPLRDGELEYWCELDSRQP